jgi:uncharacterized membrane protein
MNSHKFWTDLHGGSTHFPIALLIGSFLFDLIGFYVKQDKASRDLHSAGYYSLVLGALGGFAAVLSGAMLTQWQLMGHGRLLLHHKFVWPAFGLLTALAVWRIMVQDKSTRRGFGVYLVVAAITTILMAISGYWGGELL